MSTRVLKVLPGKLDIKIHSPCILYLQCNMYGVYLFNILFSKFLLTQILEIWMVNRFSLRKCLFDHKIFLKE